MELAKCIDEYIRIRVKQEDSENETTRMNPQLEAIVERMFERCFQHRSYKQVLYSRI